MKSYRFCVATVVTWQYEEENRFDTICLNTQTTSSKTLHAVCSMFWKSGHGVGDKYENDGKRLWLHMQTNFCFSTYINLTFTDTTTSGCKRAVTFLSCAHFNREGDIPVTRCPSGFPYCFFLPEHTAACNNASVACPAGLTGKKRGSSRNSARIKTPTSCSVLHPWDHIPSIYQPSIDGMSTQICVTGRRSPVTYSF